ncbi:hypothetical protein ACFS2C_23260 [Prauserella oleivorans]|uniref:Transcription regulator HTH AraC- type ligand binding domain-containing protein n=1 Tax=Prauserella oleivorans TaxID=1478153 RepID=A0ABW5WGR9_9PSEU
MTSPYTGHPLHLPHADSCLDARVNSRRFGETISLSAVTYGGEVTVESDEPRPFFALVVPLSGTALLRLGDDEVTVSEYSGAVVSLPTGSG